MARPPTDREATAEQLLDAAEELIRQRGAHEIAVTEIAAACGMSQSNVYRFFADKEALYAAIAERWFSELTEAMEEVVALGLPATDKMTAFFERRMTIKLARYAADPALFLSYLALGEEHYDVVSGHIDLAGHYLSVIVAQAMAEGHFAGRTIDEIVPLIDLMTVGVCDPHMLVEHTEHATPENVRRIVEVIFAGLGDRVEPRATLRLAS